MDPSRAYQEMGFLAQDAPVSFVSALRYLAGPTPDSTLVLFSLSLTNRTLSFRRTSGRFQASYRVEASFRVGSSTADIISDETVQVSTLAETQRADESVVFQKFVWLPPGEASVRVVVTDNGSGRSSSDARTVRVVRFDGRAVLSVTPVYHSGGRTSRAATPELLANPRAVASFGPDTLSYHVETYGAASGNQVTLRALDEAHQEVWRSVVETKGDTALRTGLVQVQPGGLSVGQLVIESVVSGSPDTVRTPLLVGYADHWMVAGFDGMLTLLRYFGADVRVEQIRTAPDSARAARWRQFVADTDPDPVTPQNESLVGYFSRLQVANARFRSGDHPGWLTDEGEVFVSLGEPAEENPLASDGSGQADPANCRISCPSVLWRYRNPNVAVVFVWSPALGRLRLDPSSRREFQKMMAGRQRAADASHYQVGALR